MIPEKSQCEDICYFSFFADYGRLVPAAEAPLPSRLGLSSCLQMCRFFFFLLLHYTLANHSCGHFAFGDLPGVSVPPC